MLNSDVLYNITLFWENGVLHHPPPPSTSWMVEI